MTHPSPMLTCTSKQQEQSGGNLDRYRYQFRRLHRKRSLTGSEAGQKVTSASRSPEPNPVAKATRVETGNAGGTVPVRFNNDQSVLRVGGMARTMQGERHLLSGVTERRDVHPIHQFLALGHSRAAPLASDPTAIPPRLAGACDDAAPAFFPIGDLMAFHVGQRVVCVNDSHNAGKVPGDVYLESRLLIAKGQVYTIKSIANYAWCKGGICLELLEVPGRGRGDFGYAAIRFRPVVERKTDISIFQAMLNTTHKRVDA